LKYWRGYLVAAIVAACTWGLRSFAEAHAKLVDMIYPYVTRMMIGHLSEWSSSVGFSVWQVALYCGIIIALALVVVMVVRHWNPIRLGGWILTAISIVSLLNTVLYGLNEYASPLSDDMRLEVIADSPAPEELKAAAIYYRDQANLLVDQVEHNDVEVTDELFEDLANQAGSGFTHLVYDQGYSVFAGSTVPVKQMNAAGNGVTGKTVALTGESTVNPDLPLTILPYSMCHEMSHRMCIAHDRDADFAAFLASTASDSPQFRYSGYVMAYRACLRELDATGAIADMNQIRAGEHDDLRRDMDAQDEYFDGDQETAPEATNLMVLWYVETQVVQPTVEEEDARFDPTDESQVDLSGIVNAR